MLSIHCPYSNKASWQRRQETFRMLPKLGPLWFYECVDKTTYDKWFLVKYMSTAQTGNDLLIVEHDNVPTPHMVNELETCPHPICVQDYNYSDGLSVHRLVLENRAIDRIVGDEWCDLYGFGVVRFKLGFLQAHSWSIDDIGYQSALEGLSLDSRFSYWTYKQGFKAHVHYPTSKHNHGRQVGWYGGIQSITDPLGTERVLRRLKRD